MQPNLTTMNKLAQEQLALMNIIREKANVNIVTCGHCGTILLHKRKSADDDFSITCYHCKTKLSISDCPDLWYDGMDFKQY